MHNKGARAAWKAYEAKHPRGSSSARGYGAMWQRARIMQLHAEPLCRHCMERDGRVTTATQVDHIVPLVDGGARLDPANFQSLCTPCHNAKSRKDRRERGLPASKDAGSTG